MAFIQDRQASGSLNVNHNTGKLTTLIGGRNESVHSSAILSSTSFWKILFQQAIGLDDSSSNSGRCPRFQAIVAVFISAIPVAMKQLRGKYQR